MRDRQIDPPDYPDTEQVTKEVSLQIPINVEVTSIGDSFEFDNPEELNVQNANSDYCELNGDEWYDDEFNVKITDVSEVQQEVAEMIGNELPDYDCHCTVSAIAELSFTIKGLEKDMMTWSIYPGNAYAEWNYPHCQLLDVRIFNVRKL